MKFSDQLLGLGPLSSVCRVRRLALVSSKHCSGPNERDVKYNNQKNAQLVDRIHVEPWSAMRVLSIPGARNRKTGCG